MNSCSYNNRRKPSICRSTFLRAEEIAQERARSGWNQYEGEEEAEDMMQTWRNEPNEPMPPQRWGAQPNEPMPPQRWENQPNEPMMPQRWENQPPQPMPPQQWNNRPMPSQWSNQPSQQWNNRPMSSQPEPRPIFRGPDYETVMEEQRNVERDLRMLQSMYPEAAKILLPYIEEMCDKMEYEGSMMFDRFPDQTTLYRMQDEILDQVREQFPNENMQEEPDEVLSMQYQRRRRNPPGKNWLEDMVRVMLLQEMHHRRCRHRNCRWRQS